MIKCDKQAVVRFVDFEAETTNDALKFIIEQSMCSQAHIARILKISRQSLNQRINQRIKKKTKVTINELNKVAESLGIKITISLG